MGRALMILGVRRRPASAFGAVVRTRLVHDGTLCACRRLVVGLALAESKTTLSAGQGDGSRSH